jgi:tetratricopeptide (TPR) repeat protein
MRGHLAEPSRWLGALLERVGDADPRVQVRALRQRGAFLALLDRPEDARRALDDAVAWGRRANAPDELAYALNNQAAAAFQRSEFEAARAAWVEGLGISRTLGVDVDIGRILANLANLENEVGNYPASSTYAEEAIEYARRDRNEYILMFSLTVGGTAYLQDGAIERAASTFTEALVRNQRLGDRLTIIDTLENIVTVMIAVGAFEGAARVAGATHAARQRSGTKRTFDDTVRKDEETLVQQLGEEGWRGLWTAGQLLSLDEASAEALEVIALVGVDR